MTWVLVDKTLIVSSSANSMATTVTADYVSPSTTTNNLSLAGVSLTANSGIDINMASAGGSFGYDINGGAAASTLQGSGFNDSIDGGAGADSIVGNGGNDTINAGAGADTVTGGAGNDVFTVTTGTSDQGATDVIDGGGTGQSNEFHIDAAAGA